MITVFTPTHNRAEELWRAFFSLRAQTLKNFEWLIVDDGSTDQTKHVVSKIISESGCFRVRYFHKRNQGKHSTYQTAALMSSFEYMCMLDSDDELFPWTIEVCINYLIPKISKANGEVAGCFSNAVNNNGNLEGYILKDSEPLDLSRLILRNNFGDKFELWRVEIFKEPLFPDYLDCQYVPESVAYHQISTKHSVITSSAVCIIKWQDIRDDHLTDKLVRNDNIPARRLAYSMVINYAGRCLFSQPSVFLGNVFGYIRTSIQLEQNFSECLKNIRSIPGIVLLCLFLPIFWIKFKLTR
jgi:glycosyltransferase involved in cell wall biosynthesis